MVVRPLDRLLGHGGAVETLKEEHDLPAGRRGREISEGLVEFERVFVLVPELAHVARTVVRSEVSIGGIDRGLDPDAIAILRDTRGIF